MLRDNQTTFSEDVQRVIEHNKRKQEEFRRRSEKLIKLNYPEEPNIIRKFMSHLFDVFVKSELLKSEKQVKIKLK